MEQIIPNNKNIQDYFSSHLTKTYKDLIDEISTDERFYHR